MHDNKPPQGRKTLPKLLVDVELRYQRSLADPYDPETCENSLRDNPKLVKALRRAVDHIAALCGETNRFNANDIGRDLAQLLSESADSTQSLGEPGDR